MGDAIFPALAGLEYPVVWTPVAGKTLTQVSVSGRENRAALWLYPRRRYLLSFNFLRDDATQEFRTLVGFILARQGAYDSFLFDDPDDNTATGQALGIAAAGQTRFQLVRGFGGFVEPILAPHAVTALYVDGVSVGGAFTVAAAGGLVTLATAPPAGAAITADFTYYWPCRFLEDQYDVAKILNRLWEQKKLDFITLKNWP